MKRNRRRVVKKGSTMPKEGEKKRKKTTLTTDLVSHSKGDVSPLKGRVRSPTSRLTESPRQSGSITDRPGRLLGRKERKSQGDEVERNIEANWFR